MAKFHGVVAEIRGLLESEEFDLGNISSAAGATALIKDAFEAPVAEPLEKMVRATLVVGAGKAGRQKYDASLQKWVVAALHAINYADDRSATCDFSSSGSFKVQHDTGRNLFFVHVFPRCVEKAADDGGGGGAAGGGEPEALTREHLILAAELSTFQRMVGKKCQSWATKKRLADDLKDLRARVAKVEAKRAARVVFFRFSFLRYPTPPRAL